MDCGNQVYFKNGTLYIRDDRGNCVPLQLPQQKGGCGGLGRSSVISLIQQYGGGDTFESGTFTLSADGMTLTINGNPATPIIKFDSFTAGGNPPIVGELVANDITGATGAITNISGNTFTITPVLSGGWNNSDSLTFGGGDTGAIMSSYRIITIPTAKRLKLAHINTKGVSGMGQTFGSQGNDDGTIAYCLCPFSDSGIDQSNSIDVVQTDGWTGLITVRATEFDITLTQVGAGLDITLKFHLI